MSKHFILIAFVTFGLLFSVGCKKQAGDAAGSGDANNVEITGNDQMQYNLKEIKVKAGQPVHLTLKHIGKNAKDVMGHNWVLLKQGADMNKIAQDASTAKDSDYIPAADADQIIAHTKLLGGGDSDTITFDAPPKGTYVYLCTFPGHVAMMNGKLIVE